MTHALIEEISEIVFKKLSNNKSNLRTQWEQAKPVQHFVLDDLLPKPIATAAYNGFPNREKMKLMQSIREKKFTSADCNGWQEATRAVFFALQEKTVLKALTEITGIENLSGDPAAYAGGISSMTAGHFLNPHLDNSSHPSINGYRRLNALYYVTPSWPENSGGNLELWSPRMKDRQEIHSKFNRLIVMNTNRKSLHSVNPIHRDVNIERRCISNYFFTSQSPDGTNYQHVTSFRGRPNEDAKDIYLRGEALVKSMIQRIMGKPLNK